MGGLGAMLFSGHGIAVASMPIADCAASAETEALNIHRSDKDSYSSTPWRIISECCVLG